MANQTADQPVMNPEYLTLPEVAEHYRTTEATVRYWRHIGYGPRGVKLGARVNPRAEIARVDGELHRLATVSTPART